MSLSVNLTVVLVRGGESGPKAVPLALSSAPWAVSSGAFSSLGQVLPLYRPCLDTICHLRGGLSHLSDVLSPSSSEKLHHSGCL